MAFSMAVAAPCGSSVQQGRPKGFAEVLDRDAQIALEVVREAN